MTDKTESMDLAKTLDELSKGATQGNWNHLGYCGQDGNIQGPRQEQIASLSSAWGKSDQTGHQCFANAKFIVAIVNAYRTGKLVVVPDDAVERMARAITAEVFHEEPHEINQMWPDWVGPATAALAALKGADHAGVS